MESTSPGEPVKGRCSECVDRYDKEMTNFSRTFNGREKVEGKTPDLELPDIDPDLQTEFGLDNEPGFTVPEPERDEYWR